MKIAQALLFVAFVSLGQDAVADNLKCVPSKEQWTRGYCSRAPDDKMKGIVRSQADLEPASGEVTLMIQYESDDMTEGPCGWARAILLDKDGKNVASLRMDKEGCIGGKPPGEALIVTERYTKIVDKDVISRTVAIKTETFKTRKIIRVWNISLDDALKDIKLILSVFAPKSK